MRPREIHVWRACLDQPASRVGCLGHALADEDWQQARKYRFECHRNRFVVRRAVLREILASYLEQGPKSLRFDRGSNGKLSLASQLDARVLQFSVSHAGALAVYAVTWNRRIGIDVETARKDLDVERIAERLFSVYEVSLLRSLPKSERLGAFLRIWTHKEAYLKAKGSGLADSLDSFTIFLDPKQPYGRVQIDDPLEKVRWSLQELRLQPGFVGTLAVEGCGGQIAPPVPITWKTAAQQ